MSALAKQLEKKILGKLNAISNGTETVKDAGVNGLLTRLKAVDEVGAELLQKKYIETVKSLKK
jgi:hypothetical protein